MENKPNEDHKRHEYQFYRRIECHLWCLKDGSWMAGSFAGDWPYLEVKASTMSLALAEWVRRCDAILCPKDEPEEKDYPSPSGFHDAPFTLGTTGTNANTVTITA